MWSGRETFAVELLLPAQAHDCTVERMCAFSVISSLPNLLVPLKRSRPLGTSFAESRVPILADRGFLSGNICTKTGRLSVG